MQVESGHEPSEIEVRAHTLLHGHPMAVVALQLPPHSEQRSVKWNTNTQGKL